MPLPPGAKKILGQVYALPAGSRGVNDASLLPHADFDGGTALLPLPRAGRWDVGYAGGLGAALVEDVQVAAGDLVPVRITLPAQTSVTVRFETREAADWAQDRWVNLVLRRPQTGNERWFPGRGERYRWFSGVGVWRDRPTLIPVASTDEEFEVRLRYKDELKEGEGHALSRRCPFPRWKLRPDQKHVRPGGEVRIALVEQGALQVAFALRRGTEHPWPKTTGLHVCVTLERDGEVLDQSRVEVWGGTRLRPPHVALRAAPGPATLVYHGVCCLPGRIDGIELVAGETVRVEAPIDLDPEYRYESTTGSEAPGFRVVFEGIRSAVPYAEFGVYAAGADRGASMEDFDTAFAEENFAPSNEEAGFEARGSDWAGVRWVAGFHGPDRAAPAVPVDAHTEEVVLRLAPAGHLIIVPRGWSSGNMGELFLRAADGRPLPVCTWSDRSEPPEPGGIGILIGANPNVLIGPLLPGTYEFDVLRGRTKVGRVQGTIKAGRIEVLRVPQ